ncbi:hypothetical protein YPPY92_1585, partial [Yersinia pestis PY-92]
MPRLRPPHSP